LGVKNQTLLKVIRQTKIFIGGVFKRKTLINFKSSVKLLKNVGEDQFDYFKAPIQETHQSPGPEIPPNKRQQDKIVAILESGNFDLINERQVDVRENQREGFLQKVARGEIDETKFKELILKIKPPIDYEQDRNNPVELYSSVSGNKQIRGLIAQFARGDFNQRDRLNPKDLAAFLQKYPEPSAFEKDAQGFLDRIEQANSPQKRQEYEASLKEFMHTVYGKRQEYYDQVKLLRIEADAKYPELAKERARMEIASAIRQETDERKIEQLLKKEFVNIFEDIKRRGYPVSADILYSHNYQELRNRNPIVSIAKKRIGDLRGVYDAPAFMRLEEEALNQVLGNEAQQEKSEKVEELKEARRELEDFQIETIEDKDAEKIFEKVEIHGDDFMGEFLTPEVLREEGLLPKHKIRIGKTVVWFSSSAYELDEGRVAVVAYVEKEGKVTARSYYRSNSQGVWRYLPDYRMSEDGMIDWYGKGRGEESITLPVVIQKALSEITREGMPVLKLKRNPDFIFAGTAQKFGKGQGEYYREVEASPRRLEGGFYAARGKTPPEQIRLSPEQSPDFSKLLTSWEQKTGVYGRITVEVFPSRDGALKFIFCKDSAGRVWIGGIEDDSEIQSTGLRKSWIDGGDLTTPAFEYKTLEIDQTGGYGNDKMRNGPYVDMYENYLKKIPVIQEYLNASAARQPEKRPTPIFQVERRATISGTQSFAELYRAIELAGGVQGSQQFYKPAELINIIERVRRGELGTSYITRTSGLRNKVIGLLKLEELRKREAA
jgi:hypothetical protein